MDELFFEGEKIEITNAQKNTIVVNNHMEIVADECVNKLEICLNDINSFQEIAVRLREYMEKHFDMAATEAMDFLHDNEIYTVSKEEFKRNYCSRSKCMEPIKKICDKVEKTYCDISREQHAEHNYRNARKETRGRFVGGGFGVEGAVKGMMTAGMLNLVTGMGHSLVNAVGNRMTDIRTEKRFQDAFADDAIINDALYALRKAINRMKEALSWILLVEKNIHVDIKAEDNDEYIEKILDKIYNSEFTDSSIKMQLKKAWNMNPFNSDVYSAMLCIYGDKKGDTENLIKYFGQNVYRIKLESLDKYIDYQVVNMNYESIYDCNEDALKQILDNTMSRCKELHVDIDNLQGNEPFIKKVEFIKNRLVKIDLMLRTVEGIVYPTREDAQAVKDDIISFSELIRGVNIVEEEGYNLAKEKIASITFKSKDFVSNIYIRLDTIRKIRDKNQFKENVTTILASTNICTDEFKKRVFLEEKTIPKSDIPYVFAEDEECFFYYNGKDINKAGIVITTKKMYLYEMNMLGTKVEKSIVVSLNDIQGLSINGNNFFIHYNGKTDSIMVYVDNMEIKYINEFASFVYDIIAIVSTINENYPEILVKKREKTYYPLYEKEEIKLLWDKCKEQITKINTSSENKILNQILIMGNNPIFHSEEDFICDKLNLAKEPNLILIFGNYRTNGCFEKGFLLYDTYLINITNCSLKIYEVHPIESIEYIQVEGFMENLVIAFKSKKKIKYDTNELGTDVGSILKIVFGVINDSIKKKIDSRLEKENKEMEDLRKTILQEIGPLTDMEENELKRTALEIRGRYDAEVIKPILEQINQTIVTKQEFVIKEEIEKLITGFENKDEKELLMLLKSIKRYPEHLRLNAENKVKTAYEKVVFARKNNEIETLCKGWDSFDKPTLEKKISDLQQKYSDFSLATEYINKMTKQIYDLDISALDSLTKDLKTLNCDDLRKLMQQISQDFPASTSNKHLDKVSKELDVKEKELLSELTDGLRSKSRDELLQLQKIIENGAYRKQNITHYTNEISKQIITIDTNYLNSIVSDVNQLAYWDAIKTYEKISAITDVTETVKNEFLESIRIRTLQAGDEIANKLQNTIYSYCEQNGLDLQGFNFLLSKDSSSLGSSITAKMAWYEIPIFTHYIPALLGQGERVIITSEKLLNMGKAPLVLSIENIDSFTTKSKLLHNELSVNTVNGYTHPLPFKPTGQQAAYMGQVFTMFVNQIKLSDFWNTRLDSSVVPSTPVSAPVTIKTPIDTTNSIPDTVITTNTPTTTNTQNITGSLDTLPTEKSSIPVVASPELATTAPVSDTIPAEANTVTEITATKIITTAPKRTLEETKAYINLLPPFSRGNILGNGHPKFSKKVTNAIQAYARDVQYDQVFAVYDDTILGNAKNGFIMTLQGIYMLQSFHSPFRCSYDHINCLRITYDEKAKVTKVILHTPNTSYEMTASLGQEGSEALTNQINSIVQYIFDLDTSPYPIQK